jgi:hypothetical protein
LVPGGVGAHRGDPPTTAGSAERMRLVDDHGRLFGRVNIIDAVVLLLIGVLVPLAFGAFVLFRQPVPRIRTISPNSIGEQRETTVQVTGEHLRAFLEARVNNIPAAAFLIQSTTNAEIKLPPLAAGSYDLVLRDEGTELVRVPGALTVTASRVDDAMLTVGFVALPELVKRLKAGDKDVTGTAGPTGAGAAVLTEIGPDRQPVSGSILNFHGDGPLLQREPGIPLLVQQNMIAFTGVVRVSLTSTPAGWAFRNRPVKIGSPFTFESSIGVMDGVVLDMQVPQAR